MCECTRQADVANREGANKRVDEGPAPNWSGDPQYKYINSRGSGHSWLDDGGDFERGS